MLKSVEEYAGQILEFIMRAEKIISKHMKQYDKRIVEPVVKIYEIKAYTGEEVGYLMLERTGNTNKKFTMFLKETVDGKLENVRGRMTRLRIRKLLLNDTYRKEYLGEFVYDKKEDRFFFRKDGVEYVNR